MPTLWPYPPDGVVTEALEWQTDVLEADSGVEQRIQLRAYPRRSFEAGFVLAGRDARTAENLLHGATAAEWYVPVWMDAEPLATGVGAGATSIACGAAGRDYGAGRPALLQSRTDPDTREIVTLASVSAGAVTTTAPIASTWPAGSVVAPLRTARLASGARLSRFTGDQVYGRLAWACTDHTDEAAATEATYRGLPVLALDTNWDADPGAEITRKSVVVDSGVGVPRVTDYGVAAALGQTHRSLCEGRAAIAALREWLFARRGRLGAFWAASQARDLALQAGIGAADTTLDVEHCGYTANVAQAVGRRDLRILLRNGTTYHRRITGSAVIDASTERLTLDAALGAGIALDDVGAISFLRLARLDADRIEIAWRRWDVAETTFTIRGIRNDL